MIDGMKICIQDMEVQCNAVQEQNKNIKYNVYEKIFKGNYTVLSLFSHQAKDLIILLSNIQKVDHFLSKIYSQTISLLPVNPVYLKKYFVKQRKKKSQRKS